MNQDTKHEGRSRMVVVVGVDLSDVSEHLMERARDLVRRIDDPELHVVHVMPGPRPWLPADSTLPSAIATSAIATTPRVEEARKDLRALCDAVLEGSRARVILHTPFGGAADEITRIAREVGADVIMVEVQEHHGMRRVFHRSVVARIARNGPCSVLAIRDPERAARADVARRHEGDRSSHA